MAYTVESAITRMCTMLGDPDLQRYVTNSSTLVGWAREELLSSLSVLMESKDFNLDMAYGMVRQSVVTPDTDGVVNIASVCPGISRFLNAYTPQSVNAIRSTSLNAGGGHYVVGDLLSISGGDYDATLRVLTLGAGDGVATYEIVSRGVGYSPVTGASTTNNSGSGTGCKINILSIYSGMSKAIRFIKDASVYNGWLSGGFVNSYEYLVHRNGGYLYTYPTPESRSESLLITIEYLRGVDQSWTKTTDLSLYFTQGFIDMAVREAVSRILTIRGQG